MNVIIFTRRGVRVLAVYFAFLLAVAELAASEKCRINQRIGVGGLYEQT